MCIDLPAFSSNRMGPIGSERQQGLPRKGTRRAHMNQWTYTVCMCTRAYHIGITISLWPLTYDGAAGVGLHFARAKHFLRYHSNWAHPEPPGVGHERHRQGAPHTGAVLVLHEGNRYSSNRYSSIPPPPCMCSCVCLYVCVCSRAHPSYSPSRLGDDCYHHGRVLFEHAS